VQRAQDDEHAQGRERVERQCEAAASVQAGDERHRRAGRMPDNGGGTAHKSLAGMPNFMV
jgi:hypothetical protein